MKKDIHPTYFPQAKVTCACGNSFTIGSTKEALEVEICSNCHPLYTGKEKIIDIAGRVEKFKARRATAATKQEKATELKKVRDAKAKEKAQKEKEEKKKKQKTAK